MKHKPAPSIRETELPPTFESITADAIHLPSLCPLSVLAIPLRVNSAGILNAFCRRIVSNNVGLAVTWRGKGGTWATLIRWSVNVVMVFSGVEVDQTCIPCQTGCCSCPILSIQPLRVDCHALSTRFGSKAFSFGGQGLSNLMTSRCCQAIQVGETSAHQIEDLA